MEPFLPGSGQWGEEGEEDQEEEEEDHEDIELVLKEMAALKKVSEGTLVPMLLGFPVVFDIGLCAC